MGESEYAEDWMTKYYEFSSYCPTGNRNNNLWAIIALLISQNLMLKSTSLTHRFVCHAHISRCPATKSTSQIIGFLHGSLGWVIWKLRGDACSPSGEGVHAARTVEAVGTSMIKKYNNSFTRQILPSTYYVSDVVLGVRNSRENCTHSWIVSKTIWNKYSWDS